MRLIDADALVKKWYELNDIYKDDRGVRFVGYTEIPRLISLIPTVDAVPVENINILNLVEVVRCKDCKYGEVVIKHGMGFCTNSCGVRSAINTEDYCSFGERKEP